MMENTPLSIFSKKPPFPASFSQTLCQKVKMKKHTVSIIALLCCSLSGFAQNKSIRISTVFGQTPITADTWFVSAKGDSLQFDNIRFYISALQFEMDNGKTVNDTERAHLIDVFEPSTLIIPFKNIHNKRLKKLRFNIGIDSSTSVAGALGGDLDPTHGMYWAWQSGYINMKIEGQSPQCPNRKHAFQFHIGGYMSPYYAMRPLELPIKAQNTDGTSREYREGVVLTVDVSKFFENIPISTQNSVMIPCKASVALADLSIQLFSIE